jgi:SNF family Na+-dependent transporter
MVTMPLPFILAIILAIKGSTLGAGSLTGLEAYLIPDFARVFTDIEVWTAALSQIFFTLTLGFGTMITYGSFNDRKQELVKSTIWTACLDCSISIIAGFAVFGTIGYMSYQLATESIANDEIPYQVAARYSAHIAKDDFIEKSMLDAAVLGKLPERERYSVNDLKAAGIATGDMELSKTYSADELHRLNLDPASIDKNVLTRYHLDHSKLSGPGLAFVVYPKAIAMFKPRWTAIVFGVIFFITLLSLGIDSAFSLVEAITAAIADAVHRRQIVVNHSILALIVCVAGFAEGLIYATDGGLYILDIVDHYINNFGLVFVALMQAIAVGWFFNIEEHRNYINSTTSLQIGKWWNISVRYVAPAALLYLFGSQMFIDLRTPYEGYPFWAQLIGWSVFFIPLAGSLLVGSMIRLSRDKGSL